MNSSDANELQLAAQGMNAKARTVGVAVPATIPRSGNSPDVYVGASGYQNDCLLGPFTGLTLVRKSFARSRNYYSEINFHLVWHTKGSSPLLTLEVMSLTYRALRKRIVDTPGAFVHEIGGIETHLHVAVSVPPTLTPSEWIGLLKGGTSHDVNQQSQTRDKVLQWQAGYGIVSFGRIDLPWVINYIQNQREHHGKGSAADRLEQIDHFDDANTKHSL